MFRVRAALSVATFIALTTVSPTANAATPPPNPPASAPASNPTSAPQVSGVSWYSWGFYSTYSGCMSAGAARQASSSVFVDHKCTAATYPNNGKWQLWMAERA